MVEFEFHADPPAVCLRTGDGPVALPALWLRERCQDAASLDPLTRQRLYDPHRLPAEVSLVEVRPLGGERAWLAFDDGCRGEFDFAEIHAEFDDWDGLPAARCWRG